MTNNGTNVKQRIRLTNENIYSVCILCGKIIDNEMNRIQSICFECQKTDFDLL